MNRTTPMLPEDDVRETPPDLFNRLNAEFQFTLDVCATHKNAKCPRYFTEDGLYEGPIHGVGDPFQVMPVAGGGLAAPWTDARVWCNPPFSDIGAWVEKAWKLEADLVVMLVPATRTEQPWWQNQIEPHRDRPGVLRTRFLPGRTHFLENGGPIYRKNKDGSLWLNPKTGLPQVSSPKFGCVLLIWS